MDRTDVEIEEYEEIVEDLQGTVLYSDRAETEEAQVVSNCQSKSPLYLIKEF